MPTDGSSAERRQQNTRRVQGDGQLRSTGWFGDEGLGAVARRGSVEPMQCRTRDNVGLVDQAPARRGRSGGVGAPWCVGVGVRRRSWAAAPPPRRGGDVEGSGADVVLFGSFFLSTPPPLALSLPLGSLLGGGTRKRGARVLGTADWGLYRGARASAWAPRRHGCRALPVRPRGACVDAWRPSGGPAPRV